MKVKELIEHLQHCDDEMEVMVSFPSGDYWHRTLARPVKTVEGANVKQSEYHGCLKVLDFYDGDFDDGDSQEVVLL